MDKTEIETCVRLFGKYLELHAEEIASYVSTGIEDTAPVPEPIPPPRSITDEEVVVGLDVVVTEHYTGTSPSGYRGRVTEWSSDRVITVMASKSVRNKYQYQNGRWVHLVNKSCYKVEIIPLHLTPVTDTL